MNRKFTDNDYEVLSCYLDGQLNPRDRARLELRLQADPDLSVEMEGLRETRRILRSAPQRRAPRNFTLRPEFARSRKSEVAFPAFRLASVLASILLVVTFASDLFLNTTAQKLVTHQTDSEAQNSATLAAAAPLTMGKMPGAGASAAPTSTLALPPAFAPLGTTALNPQDLVLSTNQPDQIIPTSQPKALVANPLIENSATPTNEKALMSMSASSSADNSPTADGQVSQNFAAETITNVPPSASNAPASVSVSELPPTPTATYVPVEDTPSTPANNPETEIPPSTLAINPPIAATNLPFTAVIQNTPVTAESSPTQPMPESITRISATTVPENQPMIIEPLFRVAEGVLALVAIATGLAAIILWIRMHS